MTLRDAFEVLSLSEKDLDPRSLEGVLTARLETAEFHDIPKLLEAYRTVNSLLETERWYWNPEMATNDQVGSATIEMRGAPFVNGSTETLVQTRPAPAAPVGMADAQSDTDDVEIITDEPAAIANTPVRRPTVPLSLADVSILIDDDAPVHPAPVPPIPTTPSADGFEESVRVMAAPQPDQLGVSARDTEVSTRVIDPVRPVEPGRDQTLSTQLPPSQPSMVQPPITQPRVDLSRAVLTADRDLEETTLVVVPPRRNLTAPLLVGVVALALAGGLWAIQSSRAPGVTTNAKTAVASPKPPAVSSSVRPAATSGGTSRSTTSTDRPATARPKPTNPAPQTGSQTAPSTLRNTPAAKSSPSPVTARPKPTASTAKPASTPNTPAAQPVTKPAAKPPVMAATKPVSTPKPVTQPSAPKPNASAARPAATAAARVAPNTVTPNTVTPRAVAPPPSPVVSKPTARVATTSQTTVTRPTTSKTTTQRPRPASPPPPAARPVATRPAATKPTVNTPAATKPSTPKPVVTASTPKPRPATTPRPQTPRPNTPTAAAVPAPVAVIEAPRSTGLPDNLTREEFGRRYFNQKLFEVWQRSGAELRYSSWEAVPLEIQTLDSRRFRAAVYIAPPPREEAAGPGR